MHALRTPWGHLHYRDEGPRDGAAMLFANSLGTDLRMWDGLLAHLPATVRTVRHDQRGHGLSALGHGAFAICDLADDLILLLDHLRIARAVLVGTSLGGMVALSLAARHRDRAAGLVLTNTAPRIGTPALWQDRIARIGAEGMAAMAPALIQRWFAPSFLEKPDCALWRTMLARTDPDGYCASCRAIAAADLTGELARFEVPTLVVAGGQDQATPPELVLAAARAIPGAATALIEEAGHLPAIETPGRLGREITEFLKEARLV